MGDLSTTGAGEHRLMLSETPIRVSEMQWE